MNTTQIINRLKSECASLAGRVAGAAGLAHAVEFASDWTVPHAFVVPLNESASENELLGDYSVQEVTQTFVVAVIVDNSTDEPGHSASDYVHTLFAEIRSALQGWAQDNNHRQFDYVSGNLGDYDRARLWWEFVFSTVTEVTESTD